MRTNRSNQGIGIAAAWCELMGRLGYPSFGAQGGDWGAMVATKLGEIHPGKLIGIHLNMPLAPPVPGDDNAPGEAERIAAAARRHYDQFESGYSTEQSTRPQTIGYSLTDSPAGQAAWILEKFRNWTDCDGHPENVLSRDEMLDNVTLYWVTASAASSARLYWESFRKVRFGVVGVATGVAAFPKEIIKTTPRWAARRYHLVRWTDMPRGGHFAALEQPELFVADVRGFFRALR